MTRVPVAKTYKIYIGGKFPRTESGRYFALENKKGQVIANVCRGSRKDFRNAVVAARKAQPGWAKASAYLRGQILYRIAEMLEGRREQFIAELVSQGATQAAATREVDRSIDRLIYFAGWADKYQQVFSAVNPVSSSHFNFSVLEPTGVVSILAPDESGLARPRVERCAGDCRWQYLRGAGVRDHAAECGQFCRSPARLGRAGRCR